MLNLSGAKIKVLMASMLFPVCAFAADDNFVSTLNNMTKGSGSTSTSYYLVRDKVLSENDCIADPGKDRINPGESNTLTVKKGCTWGVIKYKVFQVADNKDLGYLSHSFRDGIFSLEITMPCNGSECNFYDLSPLQIRESSNTKN